MDLQRLRAARAAAADEMEKLVNTAAEEGRELTAEEAKRFDELEAKVKGIKATIERAEASAALQAELDAPRPAVAQRAAAADFARGARGPEAKTGFESFGEYLHAVARNQDDQRLEYVSMDTTGGSNGGFAIPTQFRAELLEIAQQGAIIRPRATVIPAGSPPDAKIEMPALDQGSGSNMYGGVEVEWIGENADIPETNASLRKVALEPNGVAAYIPITNKTLNNWQAAGALAMRLLGGALTAAEEYAFLNGDGVAKPLGILNAGATYKVNRGGASTIAMSDLAEMLSRARFGGNLVWIASQSILPKLIALKDDGDQLVWQPSLREDTPDTLFGRPVIWNERSPQLGSYGDIVLADLSYYLIKDGSGPLLSVSEHVEFKKDRTLFKLVSNVDGQPWLTEPIKQEGGYEVSPFVALDIPAQ